MESWCTQDQVRNACDRCCQQHFVIVTLPGIAVHPRSGVSNFEAPHQGTSFIFTPCQAYYEPPGAFFPHCHPFNLVEDGAAYTMNDCVYWLSGIKWKHPGCRIMTTSVIRVLLIEDSPSDADLIMCYLADQTGPEAFEVEWVDTLADGLAKISTGTIDAVLSDLSLPDADGLNTFLRIHAHAPGMPVVVLTGLDDTAVAMEAVKAGAQDYLYKGDISGRLLARAVRYAIERKKGEEALKVETAQAVTQQLEGSGTVHHASQPKLKNVCLDCLNEFPDFMEVCPDDGSPLSKLADNRMIGTVIADRYEILSVLGSGGMSSIYKAKHLELGKMFAIKIIHDHLASDLTMVKRFRQEAKAVSQLSHPNIVSVQDFGITTDGQPYLVMDFLDGIDLRTLTGAPMQLHHAVPVFLQICEGLAHAHEHQVIHRDLKPDNIMMVQEPTGVKAKIVDFGLAKTTKTTQKLTRTGDVFGSPHYMSPEHCLGEPLDHRTDIYSLGCIMYECMTGYPPFDAESPLQVINKHVHESPPPIAPELGVPEWLEREIFRALEKNKERRHESAADLCNALTAGSASMAKGHSVLE